MITPKFKIGDYHYSIRGDRVHRDKIIDVKITTSQKYNTSIIHYVIEKHDNKGWYYTYREDDIRSSLHELVVNEVEYTDN